VNNGRLLVALAAVSILGACGIGVLGALTFRAWLALLIPLGLFLVLAYNLELAGGRFHSDLWFGLAWGGFPCSTATRPSPAIHWATLSVDATEACEAMSSDRSRHAKRALNWTSRERFPSASTVGGDLGNGV
jgi:hypothetical protein